MQSVIHSAQHLSSGSGKAGGPLVRGSNARTQRRPSEKKRVTSAWRIPRHTFTTEVPKYTGRRTHSPTTLAATCAQTQLICWKSNDKEKKASGGKTSI